MSEGDVWYFARGQEVVGPFSRDLLKQIHEGGQFSLETLVWREGLQNWTPAGAVIELGSVFAKPASPIPPQAPALPPPSSATVPPRTSSASATANASAPPFEDKPRLKLKLRSTDAASQGQEAPPSTKLRKSRAPDADSASLPTEDSAAEIPVAGHGPKASLPWPRRMLTHVFSSRMMTPLFLIAAAALALMAGPEFPSLLGLRGFLLIFGVFGAVSLFGLHGFDGLFRWLALLILLPPLALFWPVLMREVPVAQVTGGEWAVLAFCLLYLATLRIGLRAYPGGMGLIAVGTGAITLGALFGLGKLTPSQTFPAWEQTLKKSAEVGLPGWAARLINRPNLGTRAGVLHLRLGEETSEIGIERAVLESKGSDEWRFILVVLDGQQFAANWKGDPASVKERALALQVTAAGLTSREGLDEVDTLSGAKTIAFKGRKLGLDGGTLRLVEVGGPTARGSVSFGIQGQKEGGPLAGEFTTKVIRR
ncbi:MAG: DUF4339 domain-containing protein [Verrucomicrobiae bacterium]|nr:DUF4339 domain-containing protein [Verrucomicrobiae bacterium]